jgi:hypothetical protein
MRRTVRICNIKQGAEVTVSVALVSGVHRSLFHPLATVRHRMWAGPEEKKSIRRATNTNCGWLTKWKQKAYLCCCCSWSVFCNALLRLNERFLIRRVVRFNFPDRASRLMVCTICSLQLCVLKYTVRYKYNSKRQVIKTRDITSESDILNSTASRPARGEKKMATACAENATRIVCVLTALSSKIKSEHMSEVTSTTARLVERFRHRKKNCTSVTAWWLVKELSTL